MDISKFNKELKTKVSLARSYEKRNEIDSAIKLWLEISEMALKFSKSRNIDARYKNMLLNRTKGIIKHIKSLKAGKYEKALFEDDNIEQSEEVRDVETSKDGEVNEIVPPKGIPKERTTEETGENKTVEIIEHTELKNLPKGFKELKTSSEFTIVTPHDEEYVKKQLARYRESSKLNQDDENKKKDEKVEFNKSADEGILICFACGYDKNPRNSKVCKNCGTELN
jgi:hypothetical protein